MLAKSDSTTSAILATHGELYLLRREFSWLKAKCIDNVYMPTRIIAHYAHPQYTDFSKMDLVVNLQFFWPQTVNRRREIIGMLNYRLLL